jgi:dipeptidyl aminopeptidase/acylaminoacyl peptidase
MSNTPSFTWVFVLFACFPAAFYPAAPAIGQIERFRPRGGEDVEVWRITNDPTVRDHANYHNTQCWSPDGRYLSFTHYAADGREFGNTSAAEVHLYDLHRDVDVKVDSGTSPRWANRRNWLFYVRSRPADGPRHEKGTHVMWKDVDAGELVRIGYGVRLLKYTDCDDRWLYGMRELPDRRRKPVRVAVGADSPVETLPGDWQVGYNSLMVNPRHPMIVSRDHNYRDYYYATAGTRDVPFVARHFFDHDLAGEGRTEPFPVMEGSHFAWAGDGSYFLLGNGQMRGRKFDEPLPSNVHFLAAVSSGDVSPCGRSGRWICGDAGVATIRVADLRSGDGWPVMETSSFLCFPTDRDFSGPYDIDLKGSPDGTKIAFVCTYDLKDGPVARVTQLVGDDVVRVDSTDGFPEQGRLINASGFGGEVLGYTRKTETTFEGLSRGLYGTSSTARLRVGQTLTSFEAMLIPEELRKDLPLPPRSIRNIITDETSPLRLQRSSDLYVVVVRRPDAPHLRPSEKTVELIPGENHWETFGYDVFRDGKKITESPLRPGASLDLPGQGTYTAAGVEWSGLPSARSLPLAVRDTAVLRVLSDPPDGFSWTRDRHLVDGKEVSREDAERAEEAVRETVHLHDGVIRRAWHRRGEITRQHDLNLEGKPIRRLFCEDGKLTRREYHDREGRHVSTELFDAEGSVTESIQHGSRPRHWWYDRGVPVKYARGKETYVKEGDRWVKTE